MRKHRLAERLLTDVIGLDWELVHEEACRWEHVMSETVEKRLLELLGNPTESPYGNPIPGLTELGAETVGEDFRTGVEPLSKVAGPGSDTTRGATVLIRRISEEMQKDETLMSALRRWVRSPTGRSPSWPPRRGFSSDRVARRQRSSPKLPITSL